MAQFCTKCGSPMGEGMQFCTSCGATVGGSPAAAPPAAPIDVITLATIAAEPTAAPVPVVPAAAPGAKKGSPVLKIVLIVVAVFMLLGMLGIGACVYGVYRAKQRMSQFEKQVSNNFPSSTGTPGAQPQADNPLGNSGGDNPGTMGNPSAAPAVDLTDLAYPGATAGQSGSQSLFGAAGINMQEYLTSDSVDAVVNYYKSKLGSNAMVNQSGGNAVIQVGGGGAFTTIAVAADTSSGKTKITISSIHKQ